MIIITGLRALVKYVCIRSLLASDAVSLPVLHTAARFADADELLYLLLYVPGRD